MKFKEIEPGMIIRCENKKQMRLLLEELEIEGYVWNGSCDLPTSVIYKDISEFDTIHTYMSIDGIRRITRSNSKVEKYENVITFTDLIYNEGCELKNAAKPLIDYIQKNYDPYTKIIVNYDSVELLRTDKCEKFEIPD